MSRAKDSKDAATKIAMPASLDACQALIEQLASTVDEQNSTIETLRQEKERIQAEFALWVQRAFARRSERYINDPNQLKLDLGDDDHAADAAEGLAQAVEEAGIAVKSHVRRPRQRRDESLPEHLERYEVVVDVPQDVKNCPAHGPRQLMGYDTTEKLEYLPPQLRVRVTKYPKYACPQDPTCGVTSPERPIGLVEGDRYDTGVAAEIITAKYGYHLPVYRQQDLFAGSGWTPSRSTLLNILTAAAFVIEPLVACFKRAVLADDLVGTDDTGVTLIVPEAPADRCAGIRCFGALHVVRPTPTARHGGQALGRLGSAATPGQGRRLDFTSSCDSSWPSWSSSCCRLNCSCCRCCCCSWRRFSCCRRRMARLAPSNARPGRPSSRQSRMTSSVPEPR